MQNPVSPLRRARAPDPQLDFDPAPVAEAAVGSVVRVVGKVEPVALHQGPVSGVEVPFAQLVVHRETTGKQTYMTHAFTEDYGEAITLRDASTARRPMKILAYTLLVGARNVS